MIHYDFVPFHAIIPEMKPNVARYYTEMTTGDDYGPPDVDWDYYEAASKAGSCYASIIRDEDLLVGHAIYGIMAMPRYKTRIEAFCDSFYTEREYRGLAKNMLKKAHVCLAQLGVKETSYTINDDRVGKLLESMGLKSKYKIWSLYGQ